MHIRREGRIKMASMRWGLNVWCMYFSFSRYFTLLAPFCVLWGVGNRTPADKGKSCADTRLNAFLRFRSGSNATVLGDQNTVPKCRRFLTVFTRLTLIRRLAFSYNHVQLRFSYCNRYYIIRKINSRTFTHKITIFTTHKKQSKQPISHSK